jgi:hypothetical protein
VLPEPWPLPVLFGVMPETISNCTFNKKISTYGSPISEKVLISVIFLHLGMLEVNFEISNKD